MRHFTPIVTVSAGIEGLSELGLDAEDARTAAGIDESLLEDPWASVPLETFERLWSWASSQSDTPHIAARAGLSVPFGAFGILDHLVASADTVGNGLHALSVYFQLVSSSVELELELDGNEASVRVREKATAPYSEPSIEWTLGALGTRFCAEDQREAGPVRIELSHGAESTDVLEDAFGVPVRDAANTSKVVFPASMWGRQMRSPDPTLHENLRKLAHRADIQQFEVEPIACAVRTRLPEAVDSEGSMLEQIARSLGMSERTLQRRLREADLTFTDLVDDYRRQKATRMLAESDENIAQIAYSLGFSEQSSFTRAFKRWTGETPGSWRANRSD